MAADSIFNEIKAEEYRRLVKIINKTKYVAALAGSVFVLDRLFKESIESEPDEEFPKPLPGPLQDCGNYEKFHNDGFALGFMNKYPSFIKLTQLSTCLAIAGRICTELAGKANTGLLTGLGLVLGGGISNTFDRFKTGYVIDYINFKKKPFNRLIVNIGDIAIFAGGIISLVTFAAASLKKSRKS